MATLTCVLDGGCLEAGRGERRGKTGSEERLERSDGEEAGCNKGFIRWKYRAPDSDRKKNPLRDPTCVAEARGTILQLPSDVRYQAITHPYARVTRKPIELVLRFCEL